MSKRYIIILQNLLYSPNIFKKGISPVVAIALLLVVSVIAVVSFNSWYQSYSSSMFSNMEKDAGANFGGIGVESVIGDTLYIKNSNVGNLTVSKIIVDGNSCFNNVDLTSGMNDFSLTNCLSGRDVATSPDIVIMSEDKIIRESVYLDEDSMTAVKSNLVCVANTPEGFQGGDGTSVDPWQICNCSQLQLISQSTSTLMGNYTLLQDIDCGVSPYNIVSGFDPLVDNTNAFRGNFNGNHRIISNLYINRPTEDYIGLFGKTASMNGITSTKIENLVLKNISVNGNDYVGGLIGQFSYNTYVSLVSVSGLISGNNNIGGIIGDGGDS